MKTLRPFTLLLLTVILTSSVFAQRTDDSQLPIDPKVKIGKLSNGMTYYIRQNDHPENRVELTLAVNAGSILETEDQRGLAHMTEHMAFNGTKNFQKHEIINFLESIGMKFGPEVNAYTSFDETVYGIKVPLDKTEYLEKGLLVLHDWACGISMEDEEITKEAGIIEEEWRMGQGASDRMRRQYFPVLLANSLYAERLPIGLMEVVKGDNHEPIKRFYADWYRPDLMAVVVVGDIDIEKVEKMVKDLFSQIPAKANPKPRTEFSVPDHAETKAIVVTDAETQQSVVQVFYKHDQKPLLTHGDYRQTITNSLYNQMINNRLQELTVKEDAPFLYGYSGYSSFLADKDAYVMFAMIKPEKIRESLKSLFHENERVKQFGFTSSELERAQKSLLKSIEKMFNERNTTNSESFVSEYVAHYLPPHPAIPGIEYEYELYKTYVPEITLAEINAMAAIWLKPENRVVIAMGPEKDVASFPSSDELRDMVDNMDYTGLTAYTDNVSDKPLVEKMPTAGNVVKEKKDKKLGTTTWTLNNGATVVIKNTDFKADEILFRAYSLGGYSLVSEADDISAKYAADIFTESGLGNFDKIQLDKYLQGKNVSLSPFITELTEGFNGRTSPTDLETFLQVLYMHFQQPRRDETAFKAFMNREVAMIENKSLSPEQVFWDSVSVVMSKNHPRSKPVSADLLGKIDYAKANYIYKTRFSDPGNFTYYFVGNIDLATAKPLIEKYIGGLPAVKKEETWTDLRVEKPQGKVEKTVYKGVEPKSQVYMNFHNKFEYTDKNLMLLDLTGKLLTTRLLEIVREEESGVYSIGAYPSPSHFPTAEFDIVVYFGCNPENTNRLSTIVEKQIAEFKEKGPNADELNKAIQKAIREKETGVKENRYWLGKLYDFDYHKRDKKAFQKYEKMVNKVSAEDIKAAFNMFFGHGNEVVIQLQPETLKK